MTTSAPKRILITGGNGTVGSALRDHLASQSLTPIAWDRSVAPPADPDACAKYVEQTEPDAIVHLAVASTGTGLKNEGRMVAVDWTAHLAQLANTANIPFLFSSTVMVFTNKLPGPFTPDTAPDETEGYGSEKHRGEHAALKNHTAAVVARLGWQIGSAPGSNNMIDYLHRQTAEHGAAKVSTKFRVSCAFLQDTAAALHRALTMPSGVYMLEGNQSGHSLYDIASALAKKHPGVFKVEPIDDFDWDQRMLDDRMPVAQIDERLEFDPA